MGKALTRVSAGGATCVALVYGLLVTFAYLNQRRFEYAPTHEDIKGYGTLTLEPWRNARGDFLGYVRHSPRPERVVVLFHGMGGEALNWRWYEDLIPENQTLILAEYPGFGARLGQPTEASLFRSAQSLMRAVQGKWQVPVTVIGESLGTGVACFIATHTRIDRLALVSPFTSVQDVAAHHLPFLPINTLLHDRFPSLTFVARAKTKLHVIHGAIDDVVPLALAQRLFSAYSGLEKTLTVVPGAGHDTINYAILKAPVAAAFRDFIRGSGR